MKGSEKEKGCLKPVSMGNLTVGKGEYRPEKNHSLAVSSEERLQGGGKSLGHTRKGKLLWKEKSVDREGKSVGVRLSSLGKAVHHRSQPPPQQDVGGKNL